MRIAKKEVLLISLIFLFLNSFLVMGESELPELNLNTDTYSSLGKHMDPGGAVCVCNHGVTTDCWYDNHGLYDHGEKWDYVKGCSKGSKPTDDDVANLILPDPEFRHSCDGVSNRGPEAVGINIDETTLGKTKYLEPSDKGCWFLLEEQEGGMSANEFAEAQVKVGYVFDYQWRVLCFNKEDSRGAGPWCWGVSGNDDAKYGLTGAHYRTSSDGDLAYICSDDHFWHACNDDDNIGTMTWAGNWLFNCTTEDDIITWEKLDVDYDGDGYTGVDGDCDQGTENKGLQEPGCPEFGHPEDCSFPADSKCAICINPGVPETCGDGVDNDCNGVSEECDDFKEGCMQEAVIEDLLNPGEWVGEHYNVHGISFPWVKTGPNEGFCCGFNGIDDLGKTVTRISEDDSEGELGEFVCLNTELTGAEDVVPGGGEEDGYCKGKWCLSNAVGGPTAGGKYTIFTVKPIGEEPYDIVSNGQEWLTCNETSTGWLKEYPLSGLDDEFDDAVVQSLINRFYCYNEGDHYAWAECADGFTDRQNEGVKGRYPGDGLFSLPLDKGELEGGIKVSSSNVHRVDINVFKNYDSFYNKEHLLDFTGYTHLNFMVQFCDKAGDCKKEDVLSLEELKLGGYLPLDIELSLLGKDDVVLLKKSVLGDITNSPQFDPDVWLHIETKIPADLKGVRSIQFNPSTPSRMRLRNVYLSKDNNALLCSGKNAQEESSWIKDMDQGSPKKDITGEDLCKELYGDNAWLGKDSQIDNAFSDANCCGDDKEEYYAGPSVGEEERFACWNSQVIKDKTTSTNVEFSVDYKENTYDIKETTFSSSSVGSSLSWNATVEFSGESIHSSLDWDWGPSWSVGAEVPGEYSIWASEYAANEFCKLNGLGPVTNFTSIDYGDEEKIVKYEIYDTVTNVRKWHALNFLGWSDPDPQIFDTIHCGIPGDKAAFKISTEELSIGHTQEIIGSFIPREILPGGGNITSQMDIKYTPNEKFNFKLYNGQYWEEIGTENEEGVFILNKDELKDLWYSTIYLVIELKPEIPTLDITPGTSDDGGLYSYSCSEKECLYPLPGDPNKNRKIKNLHPELYDLYFVYYNTGTEDMDYKLISGEDTFKKPGNVIAKKVSQQVMFVADAADELNSKFYSCQAADYILNNNEIPDVFLDNQPHCSIQGDSFCAPSVNEPAIGNQDQYTLVNSWSVEPVSQVGYKDDSNTENFDDLKTYFDSLVLELKPPNTLIEPTERNYTTSVVPFRNIIPNAEFRLSGGEIPHWEILKNNKAVDEVGYIDEENNKLIKSLKGSEILRSEKIAINQTGTYYFHNNGTATDIKIYDDGGNLIPLTDNGTFESNTQFIIIKFSKGTVYRPFLQLVDDLGIGEYNYEHPSYPDEYDFRSGLSCCKPDQCWNGYTCVEPMENVAIMTEHFGVGKDYRCIDGQWTHLPVKWDWNNQKWGFCTQEEQCFVTKNGQAENTISSFLDKGKAPICINSGESILDHYCENGKWTSRTKFLASKLVEVAGNDDFILYCTNYNDALLHPGNEIYLGGKSQDEKEEVPGLDGGFIENPQEDELSYTCFKEMRSAEDGKELVPQDENTCINNMCVLRYTEGGQFKTAFATTLNKNITDTESSFLLEFNVDQENLNTICAGEDDFVKCDFDAADMWYSKDLNAIVYGKQGIQLNGGIFGNALNGFVDWFKDLTGVGTDLPEFEQFVFNSQNFNEIYLLDKEGKKAKVVREAVNGSDLPQQSILAEYEGFTTPICEYTDNLALPPDLQTEFLLIVSGYNKYTCTSEAGKQKLQLIVNEEDSEGLDYFWPQLTGKLRVGSFD
jgi:hypothetical protein